MKNKIFIFLFFCAFASGYTLFISGNQTRTDEFRNYKKIQKESARPGMPDKAMEWYINQRTYPLGIFPDGWREKALAHIDKNNRKSAGEKAAAWQGIGPGNIGGRIRSLIVDPNNSDIIYLGSVSGGVWKTTNGGASWVALKDNMENLAVTSLAFDPASSNIIYAGTGEGFFNLDAIRGLGIFKSTDAGLSWTQLTSTNSSNFYYVNKIELDPGSGTMWVGTRKGLFKSTDGGGTFSTVLSNTGNDVHCTDVEIIPGSPAKIFTSFGLFNQATLYRSTNGGTNFTQVFSSSGLGRIEIGVQKFNNSQIAYASAMSLNTYQVGAMLKTTDGGATWNQITIPSNAFSGAATYTSAQGWYNNIVAVNPTNASQVYVGGLDVWKSTNGGTTWTQITNWYSQSGAPPYIHADQHYITFSPTSTNTVFVGCDGGIYKSTNGGTSWNSLNNGLAITQFYYGAVHPTQDIALGGTQDNGTLIYNGSSFWDEVIGGDGGAVEIDYTTPTNMYGEYVNFCFFKSTDGGLNFTKSMSGIPTGTGIYDGTTDRTAFITPFTMDPNTPSILAGGTYRVWRTTNRASSWTSISGDLTGDGSGSSGATISAITIAKGNSSVIYVGCSNGRVQVTTNTGSLWNLRNSGLPSLFCTKIAVQSDNPAVAVATFSGFTSGSKVYRTTNYGSSWSNISGNLPNIPVSAVFIDPENSSRIFIGTDLGVFVSTNTGSSWTQETNGFPNVPTVDLDYRASDKTLWAFTHGRGAFKATLTSGGGGGNILPLVYDNGIPTKGYYWPNTGQASANRMTSPQAGAQLLSISFYIFTVSAGNAVYKPLLLNPNGSMPGSPAINFDFRNAGITSGWDEIDLSSLNITATGDFYIGMMYDGTNRPQFAANTTNNGRAWDYDGVSWSFFNETYFMRASMQGSTGLITADTKRPDRDALSVNYPNPFKESTKFTLKLKDDASVKFVIYSSAGEELTVLADAYLVGGIYTFEWNGKNNLGNTMPSGIYYYRTQINGRSYSGKMVIQR